MIFRSKSKMWLVAGLCLIMLTSLNMFSKVALSDEQPTPAEEVELKKNVRMLLVEGRRLFLEGHYDAAIEKFRQVTDIKPNHLGARIAIQTVQDEKDRLADLERENAVEDRMLNHEKSMHPERKPFIDEDEMEASDKQLEDQTSVKRLEMESKLQKRIPEINFTNAHLRDVIQYLHTVGDVNIILDEGIFESYEQELPDIPVSIDVNGEQQQRYADTYYNEPENDDQETIPLGEPEYGASSDRVTISLRDIPLIEALKYILRTKKLRYRVDDYAVWISRDVLAPEMLTRSYQLLGGKCAINKLTFDKPSDGTPAAGARIQEIMNIKDFIRETIPFPPGSKMYLDERSNTLVVSNTKENHDMIAELVEKLSVPPVQVEIETRFVEIAQYDAEELGLELFIASPDGINVNSKVLVESNAHDGTFGRFTDPQLEGFTTGLRFLSETINNRTNPAGNILAISGILGERDLRMVLHALNQRQNVDILNCPKVTTLNGHQAEIKVVTEFWYPQEFEVIPAVLDGTGTEIVPAAVEASDFTRRDVGCLLTVTPDVGGDHKTITLTIVPEVSRFITWIDYGIEDAPQLVPIFSSDNVATSVILKDSETVVLGGTVRTEKVKTEDKIPFLGDIPYIGRAFRSNTETDDKINLLIFVTARVITPNGEPLQQEIRAARSQAE
ncbi:MAG: hypothetical protein C4541_11890 [Candidatus Auribacter fodinae]|uniref:Type II/III secretion system secretin-like domain-containing protein n=1 Tax=Candidatus Auribacter fodinae TaxID=2093366 RepID=A0A3A4R5F2_9BACT|nr:MAG: hypothetical protein C4541_11890 [Candidatus Auribacter fodinae]